ncbi:MAG: hypothetical protein ACLSHU_04415 [Oscillospiraceae bacterium]
MELECDRLVCQHLSSTEQLSYLNAIKKMIQPGSPNGDKIPMGFVGRTSKKCCCSASGLPCIPNVPCPGRH